MSLRRTYYLERSPLTGQLQSAEETSQEGNFYRPGELYMLVPGGFGLTEQYALRAVLEADVIDDRLERIAGRRYRLEFSSSNLKVREPTFTAIRAGNYRGASAWLLVEDDPGYLDLLEARFGYNPIGDTSIGETAEGFPIGPFNPTPQRKV